MLVKETIALATVEKMRWEGGELTSGLREVRIKP